MTTNQAIIISDLAFGLGLKVKNYDTGDHTDTMVRITGNDGDQRNFENYAVALGFIDGIKFARANANLSTK